MTLKQYFKNVFHSNDTTNSCFNHKEIFYLAPQYLLVCTISCRVVFLLVSLSIQTVEIIYIYYFMYVLTTNGFYIINIPTRTQCFGFKLW